MIAFELDGEAVSVDGIDPRMTVLQWLRGQGRTGTKEGCAEGDCGACTVALLDRDVSGDARWRSVCSCLLLVPMLHGRKVVTAEGLRQGKQDHPAQSAIVAALGSQCGFCTPGVVMSAFEACYRPELAGDSDAAVARRDDQMCGNLCRCTGYRPIRDAVAEVAGSCPSDAFAAAQAVGAAGAAASEVVTGSASWRSPASLDALWPMLAPGVRVVCGATDVGVWINKHATPPDRLVSIEAISSLRGIAREGDGFRVGAATVLADLEGWSETHAVLLFRMLRWFASRQIKNRATIGGNLCNASPIGDLAPVLLAHGAVLRLASALGERDVPIDSFFLGYRKTALRDGEILASVWLPDLAPDVRAAAFKVSKRRELDISAVSAAMAVQVVDGRCASARLAFGGMAATPARARRAEAAMVGQPWTEATVRAAMQEVEADFQPLSDHRGSSWYRLTVAKNLIRGFFLETAAVPQPWPAWRPVGAVGPG